jgi:hypothetical protein
LFAALVGISELTIGFNTMTWLPDRIPVKQAALEVERSIGGTSNVSLLIKTKDKAGLKDRELLEGLAALEQYIEAYRDPIEGKPIVTSTISLLDLLRESWRALHDGKSEYYKIPDTDRGVVDMFTLLENAAFDELKNLVTIDLSKSLMDFRVRWMDGKSYGPFASYIQDGIDRFIGDKAEVKITGSAFLAAQIASKLVDDLVNSFSAAFVVVTLMMILMLRDFKLGLISMVPNLLPVFGVLGFMGYWSIPIHLGNIVIASVIIGIAVDDTIHFLHQFKTHYGVNKNVEAAIEHAFSHTGRALVSTSIILGAGLLVFLVATLQPLLQFGELTLFAVCLALLFDLVVSPALLRVAYKTKAVK